MNYSNIGAARGDFMALMLERGWKVTGIEPFATENPHGLRISRLPFPEECELEDGQFDMITAWAVFEHRTTLLWRSAGRWVSFAQAGVS